MREVAYCRKSWRNNYRDSSFVRVSVHWLLVLLSLRYLTTRLLALVSNNGTHLDTTLTPSSFTTLSNTTQIIALALISLVCGHFCYGTMSPQWAIIDCSTVLPSTRPLILCCLIFLIIQPTIVWEYSCYTQAFSMFLLRVVSDSTQPRPFQLGRFLANQPSASCQILSCLSRLVSPRLASLTVDSPDQHIILSLIPSLVLSRLVSC